MGTIMKKTKKKNKTIKWIIILLLTSYFLTGYAKGINLMYDIRRQATEDATMTVEAMSVPEMIDYIAPQYGADTELLKKITFCEASHNLGNVIHDGGRGTGTTGFLKNTFNDWKVKLGRPELVYESNFDQLTLMAIAFEKGESYRMAWTSYRAYINGGTYTFYSSYEHRWITVHCK